MIKLSVVLSLIWLCLIGGTGNCSGEIQEVDPPNNGDNNYVIIAKENVDMTHNTVFSGGVGVLDEDGEATFDDETMITAAGTFVRSAEINISGGSVVTDALEEPAMFTLPDFYYNPLDLNNDFEVSVGNGETMILDQEMYEDLRVGRNATVIFSGQGNVYIESISINHGATILFDQCTNLIVKEKVRIGKDVQFNPDQENVYVYAEDEITIKRRTVVYGVLYTMDDFKVRESEDANEPTQLYGMFIAEDVRSDDYVHYYYQSSSACDAPSNIPSPAANKAQAYSDNDNTIDLIGSDLEVSIFPNPARTTLNLSLTSSKDYNTTITIVGVDGKQKLNDDLSLVAGVSEVQIDLVDYPSVSSLC